MADVAEVLLVTVCVVYAIGVAFFVLAGVTWPIWISPTQKTDKRLPRGFGVGVTPETCPTCRVARIAREARRCWP
jgi:hypothetical protein